VPVIAVRSIESYLRLYDKQVVMMGGLYSSRTALEEEKIPILSDLPFIGELFTGKNHAREVIQLVFFVKIHIVSPDDVLYGFMYDPNEQMVDSERVADLVVDDPESKPKHEKAVVGLVDEMVASFNKTWLPASNERKKRDAMSENNGNSDNGTENKNSSAAPDAQPQQKKD
jgi:Flp pilus assembly secretin CpaC